MLGDPAVTVGSYPVSFFEFRYGVLSPRPVSKAGLILTPVSRAAYQAVNLYYPAP